MQWSNQLHLYVMMFGESFKISICCVFIISIIIIFCYKLNKFTLYIFLDVAPMSFGANFSQHVGEIESVDWRLTMSWVTSKWLHGLSEGGLLFWCDIYEIMSYCLWFNTIAYNSQRLDFLCKSRWRCIAEVRCCSGDKNVSAEDPRVRLFPVLTDVVHSKIYFGLSQSSIVKLKRKFLLTIQSNDLCRQQRNMWCIHQSMCTFMMLEMMHKTQKR